MRSFPSRSPAIDRLLVGSFGVIAAAIDAGVDRRDIGGGDIADEEGVPQPASLRLPSSADPHMAERPQASEQRSIGGAEPPVQFDVTYSLMGGDAIPIGEQCASAAIVDVAGLLGHRARPGKGELPREPVVAKEHIGDARAFS